jgi:tetratricopeptide (TPR) repeat protein
VNQARSGARDLHDAAVAAQNSADYLTLSRLAHEMIALARRDDDKTQLAWGHYFSGASNFQRNDGPSAAREYRKARDLFTALDDKEGVARSMLGLAAVALDVNLDAAQARELYDHAVPIIRQLGDKRRLGIVLGNLGEICRLEGSSSRALEHAREAVSLLSEAGDHAHAGWQLASMGHYYVLRRDEAAALESMHRAYAELALDPIPRWIAWYFDVWFIIEAWRGRWETAALILSFVNRYRDERSCPRNQGFLPWFSQPVEELSQHLGADRLHELFAQGEELDVESAQALVARE